MDAYEILGDPEVRKAAFWSYVYRKTVSLPRQARDKHRKSREKRMRFLQVRMAFDEYGGLDPEAESFDSFAQYLLRSTFSCFIFPSKSPLSPSVCAWNLPLYLDECG